MRKFLRALGVIFALQLSPGLLPLAYSQTTTAFGPEVYIRGTGDPQRIVKNFSVEFPTAQFTLTVQNGESKRGRVSSAIIEINGTPVVTESEFNKQVDLITKPVNLQQQNTIAVTVKSQPETSLTVTIQQTGAPSATEAVVPAGGTVTLPGFGSTIFPSGAFPQTTQVTISATNSPETQDDFAVSADIFSAGPRVPYEVRINSGLAPPSTSFEVALQVPQSFIATLPPSFGIKVFAQIYQSGGQDVLDNFELFSSTFDATANTVHAILPANAFTKMRRADHTYEAIVVIGSAPILQSSAGTRRGPPLLARPHEHFVPVSWRLGGYQDTRQTTDVLPFLWLTQSIPGNPTCEGGNLGTPLEGDVRVGSPFNPSAPHYGTDYIANDGDNVLAVSDGTISKIGFNLKTLPEPDPRSHLTIKGWGRYVILEHGDKSKTLYAHLQMDSTNHLAEGQPVTKGFVIGKVGSTGGATGPHLHMEHAPNGNIFQKPSKIDSSECIIIEQVVENFFITCTTTGQICDPPFSISIGTGSRLQLEFTTSPGHCSDLRVRIFVDGALKSTSNFLGAGASTGLLELGPVASGSHTISVQGEGRVGGCNFGDLVSWAGTVRVLSSPF